MLWRPQKFVKRTLVNKQQSYSVRVGHASKYWAIKEDCLRHFISGKGVVALLPAVLFTVHPISGKLHQLGTLPASQPNISGWVNSDLII